MPKFFTAASQRFTRSLGAVVAAAILLSACRPATVTPVRTPSVRTEVPPAQATPTQKVQTPDPPPSPTIAAKPTSTIDVDPASLRGRRVDLWHAWAGEVEPEVRALVDDFNAANEWGIVAVASAHYGYDSLMEGVEAALKPGASEAEEKPEILLSYDYQSLDQKTLVDLNSYLQDPVWGLDASGQEDFLPIASPPEAGQEPRLGWPAPRSAQLLYYNQTWGEELGFREAPQTTADFKKQACTAAQANAADENPANDGTGGWIISTHYPTVAGWLHAFGAEFSLPQGNGYRFNTPEVKSALTFLRELYTDGCAWLSENEFPENEFALRQGLFSTGSLAGIPYQAEALQREGSADRWTVIPFPGEAGEPAVSVYGPSYRLLKSSPEEQLAAWLFLRWLAAPENEARLARAAGALPTRQATLDLLASEAELAPQYRAGLELLPYAHIEPSASSWSQVRWAVSDAATQLFRSYFELEQLPAMVRLLDRTAKDFIPGE
jgi:multiple sugar transport system substrate-binding protein/sn-glycerol 3-phosphate transport system substrate-binding protein